MNKKIFLSLLTIFSIASMTSAGTWAYFSDTQTSELNSLTAGALELDTPITILSNDGEDTYLVPGRSVCGLLSIKNNGTVPGVLYIKKSSANKESLNYFTVTTTVDEDEYELGNEYIKIGALDAGESVNLPIEYSMNKDATEGQGTTAKFAFDVLLIQQGAPVPTHL